MGGEGEGGGGEAGEGDGGVAGGKGGVGEGQLQAVDEQIKSPLTVCSFFPQR